MLELTRFVLGSMAFGLAVFGVLIAVLLLLALAHPFVKRKKKDGM